MVLRQVFAALLDNPLHVAALRSDETSCNLELLVVWDLDVVPASVFGLAISIGVVVTLHILIVLHLLRDETGLIAVLSEISSPSLNKLVLSLNWLINILHFESGSKLVRWDKPCLRSLVLHQLSCHSLRHLLRRLETRVVNVHWSRVFLVATMLYLWLLFSRSLLRQPFDRKHDVKLGNVEPLQRLLCIEGTKEVIEVDECGLFVVEHLDALDSTELAEYLFE